MYGHPSGLVESGVNPWLNYWARIWREFLEPLCYVAWWFVQAMYGLADWRRMPRAILGWHEGYKMYWLISGLAWLSV